MSDYWKTASLKSVIGELENSVSPENTYRMIRIDVLDRAAWFLREFEKLKGKK